MFRGYKGKFKPKNPDKYVGDLTKITYRSFLEYKVMQRMDSHPEIVLWASEEVAVPYKSPKDRKVHRYFPDIWFQKQNGEKWLVEIKPEIQCRPPKQGKTGKANKRFKRELITFAVNKAKWQAAQKLCEQQGWKWKILTDKEINGK